MSEETIVHIYCDGKDCLSSIDGYGIGASDEYKKHDMTQRGWSWVEEDDIIDGKFCGFPLIIKRGEIKHYCNECRKDMSDGIHN